MLKKPELFKDGFHLSSFPLEDEFMILVQEERWNEIDERLKALTSEDGRLFKFVREFHDFQSIEFIISVRDSSNEWEEDGIWHDDGSRVFAFSLSLTTQAPEGGRLGIRQKGQTANRSIPTPSMGGIILFLTGLYGFEHKIHRVTKGRRIIIAGWCT